MMRKGYKYAEDKYQLGFRATKQVKEDITALAIQEGLSVQKLIEKLVLEYIELNKQKEP